MLKICDALLGSGFLTLRDPCSFIKSPACHIKYKSMISKSLSVNAIISVISITVDLFFLLVTGPISTFFTCTISFDWTLHIMAVWIFVLFL